MLEITKFCGFGDVRSYCNSPFKCGDYVAATNGHIAAVLLEPTSDIIATENHRGLEKVCASILGMIEKAKNETYAALPAYDVPEPKQCHACRGCGNATVTKCDECDGEGEIIFETHYHEYECTCQGCGGRGTIINKPKSVSDVCPFCKGTGKEWEWNQSVNIAGRHIYAQYADIIKNFENVEVEQSTKQKMDLINFRQVIGGKVTAYIFVMPMNVSNL